MTRPTALDRLKKWTSPEPNTGCWLWAGSVTAGGYGVIGIGSRMVRAHRATYEAYVGRIPDGKVLMHSCDNPACVNPDHLKPGSHKENAADMIAKGRNYKLPADFLFKKK